MGEQAYLWAGASSGRITIGENCRLGPEVFVTASDYGLMPDQASRTRCATSATSSSATTSGSVYASSSAPASRSATAASSARTPSSRAPSPAGAIAAGVPARVVRRREDYAQRSPERARRAELAPIEPQAGEPRPLDPDRQLRVPGRDPRLSRVTRGPPGTVSSRDVVAGQRLRSDGTAEMVVAEFPDVRLLALRREPRFRRRSQPSRRQSARRVPLAPQPGHRRPRGHPGQHRRLRARASRVRALRRSYVRSRWHRQPRLVLGQAVALEPLLLRDHALDRVQAIAGLRPRVAREVEARLRYARSKSSPGASCSTRASLWQELRGFDSGSSCTARTPTSLFEPPDLAFGT